jgi:hypothetical protein
MKSCDPVQRFIIAMTHQEKVDQLIADLGQKGMNPYAVAPPLFRLLWALGLRVRPPLFMGFLSLTLLAGVFFGASCGLLMWLMPLRPRKLPVEVGAATSLIAGLLFGLSMATYYRWKFKRLRLPPWENYPETMRSMSKTLSSNEASRSWIRFWIPVLASVYVTPICLVLGLGGMTPILFPFTEFWIRQFHSIPGPIVLLAAIQFPAYAIILGFANMKRKLFRVALVLLVIHALGIGSNYAFYYYGYYQSLRDPNNQLLEAVRKDDVPTAKHLLDEAVDPNFHRVYGGPSSLLTLACMDGHLEMAKLLLEKGADINYADPFLGHTALFSAVLFHREQIVELLLSKGADLTVKDREGFTALERVKRSRQWQESNLKRTKREPEDIAEELKPYERIISLLEAAAKDQKKP